MKELFDYYRTIQNLDESYNQVKLELLVFKIQYCNSIKDYKQSKKIYLEADKLKENNIMADDRLNSIVDEEGGKFFMSQKNYALALEKFKQAFTSYKNSGNIEASKRLLKFSFLTDIVIKTKTYANLEEVKK